MKARFIIAACFFTGGFGSLHAQLLEVVPGRVMVDESAAIRAYGLQPNERITIRAELTDGAGQRWRAQAEFIADARGVVDTSQLAPVAGSYREVSAMGLIWSMMPIDKKVTRYQNPKDLDPQTVEFSLMKGERVSSAQLVQRLVREGVQRVTLEEGGLCGTLFLPCTKERSPGVLVLGGSEGGVPFRQAAWLASHGFAALALAYFRYEDLPAKLEAIPLEYFGRALTWMTRRPEVLGNRIAVVGASRGGELALQLGSMFPQIAAVVAYAPSNVRRPACCGDNRVPYAWTWTGRPLAYLPLRLQNDPPSTMIATIEVEKTQGPILLISGQDDHVWPSSMMAKAVVGRLKMAHFHYQFEHLEYPHAGHSAGRSEIVPAWHGRFRHPVSGRVVDLGGSARGDANSSIDAIPKVLEFLLQSFLPH